MAVSKCAVNQAEAVWARSVCRPDEPGRWRIGYYDHKGASYMFAVGHGAVAWAEAFAREASAITGELRAVRHEVGVFDPFGFGDAPGQAIEVGVVTGNDIVCGDHWDENGWEREQHG